MNADMHAESAAKGPPRHAQVVPAFVASMMRRPMDSWVGEVQPGELLRWERKGDLSESARRDLRKTIVKRNRVRSERLWTQCVGVHLAEGWKERLSSVDRRRIEQMRITPDKPLQLWTLREVKVELKVPLENTLGILARLESVYWESPLPTQQRANGAHVDGGSAPIPTASVRARATEVLLLPWLSRVSKNDLRFGYAGEGSLSEWVEQKIQGEMVLGSFAAFLDRLLKADKLTAEEEAAEIAAFAVRECGPRGDEEASQRWVSMLMRRHITPKGDGRTLADVGADFGVTRERVRQICDAFEELFVEGETCTPSLDRVLAAAARVAPCEVNELDEQLRRFIGDGAGIECLASWAKVLGHTELPVHCTKVRARVRNELVELTMVQRPNVAGWVEPMIRHISRDSSMFGCTNVLRIAGRLALKEGVAPGQEAIETALEAANGFRWLDKETGWFVLGETSGCSAASRVRKIMAVAEETVGADEIAAALASDDMMIYRDSSTLGLATPPVHVLRELFRTWTWLTVVQKARFQPSKDFEHEGALSEVEQACVEVITANHGVACRFELKEVVMGRLGLTDVLLAANLGSSPIFVRIEHGLYSLIGRKVGNGAVNAARQRLRMRASPSVDGMPVLGANEFIARVTEASLKNEQYGVPTIFKNRLSGRRHAIIDHSGLVLGEARVGQAGALVGLNRHFKDVAPGDHYLVEVLEEGLRVRLVVQPART